MEGLLAHEKAYSFTHVTYRSLMHTGSANTLWDMRHCSPANMKHSLGIRINKTALERSWSDIVILHAHLVAGHPELIVPPLPVIPSLPTPVDRDLLQADLVDASERDAVALFINRLASHETLCKTSGFRQFMDAKNMSPVCEWARVDWPMAWRIIMALSRAPSHCQIYLASSPTTSSSSKNASGFGKLLKGVTTKSISDPDPWFAEADKQLDVLLGITEKSTKSAQNMVQAHKGRCD